MSMLTTLSKRLLQSKKAATAVIFAITVPVIIGGTALAVDVASFRVVQSRMQAAVDAAALTSVMEIEAKGSVETKAVDVATSNVPANFGVMTKSSDVTVGTYSKAGGFVPGTGPTANAVRVYAERSPARSNGVGRIFGLLWGNSQITISTTAIAARPVNVFYDPPQGVVLDNSAHDFNEMYAYCYDMKGVGPVADRRTKMTLIANNLGATSAITHSGGVITADPVTPMPWPDCSGQDQSLSFRLVNYRSAKHDKTQWSKPGGPKRFDHYSDTQIANGIETFDTNYDTIVERYICDTTDACDPSKPGIVQTAFNTAGKNPQNKVTTACEPGKFIYMGMEDRPPSGSSDRDYNDIAIRMKCPNSGRLADPFPRLVG